MESVLGTEILAADDVLLRPGLGRAPSRTVPMFPFIYSAPMDTVTGYDLTKAMLAEDQMPVLCRNLPIEEWLRTVGEFAEHPNFWIAIGQKREHIEEFFSRLEKLELPDDTRFNLAIDVAHGDSVRAHQVTNVLSSLPMVGGLMSGSIATGEGAIRAAEAGASHIRVGIGPGAACTTRVMTGCGVPQLHAVYDVYTALLSINKVVEVIADGGIKNPGDAAKYMAAGADGIMMGSVFSRAWESPGWEHVGWIEDESRNRVVKFPRPDPTPNYRKQFRGHSSAAFQNDHFGAAHRCPEGASSDVFYYDEITTVKTVCELYKGGVGSCVSYTGGVDLNDLNPQDCVFQKITPAAQAEGRPHGV